MIRYRILYGAVLVFLFACNKTPDTPANTTSLVLPDGRIPSALVAALDSVTMAAMELRTGVWSEADASSRWRAMSSNGKVRVIDETMNVGEASTRQATHYFTVDEKPAAYIEFRTQTVTAGDRPPAPQFVLIMLEFVGDSTILATKKVDDVSQPVLPFEIENARKHSWDLLAAARSAPTTSPAKP